MKFTKQRIAASAAADVLLGEDDWAGASELQEEAQQLHYELRYIQLLEDVDDHEIVFEAVLDPSSNLLEDEITIQLVFPRWIEISPSSIGIPLPNYGQRLFRSRWDGEEELLLAGIQVVMAGIVCSWGNPGAGDFHRVWGQEPHFWVSAHTA